MANCREIEAKLAEYVDGHQAEAERAAVERHLQSCPPCRTRAAGERAAHDLVCARRDTLRAPAPGHLRERCAAQRQAARPPAAVLARTPWVRFSLAASVLLAAGLFVLFGWGSSVETYAAQLSADHLKCFQYPPEATSAPDVTLLGRTWQTQSGWGLKVASSSTMEGLTLLGIRKCGSSRGRVAHIFYRWHGEAVVGVRAQSPFRPERQRGARSRRQPARRACDRLDGARPDLRGHRRPSAAGSATRRHLRAALNRVRP